MNPNTDDTRELCSIPEPRPVWHRPEVSKISIDKTLIFNGSPIDSATGSS